MYHHLRGASLLILSAMLVQPAVAQSTSTETSSAPGAAADNADPVVAPIAPPATETQTPAKDEILVTGSRLPSEFSGLAPVQVLTTDRSALRGAATAAEIVSRATAAAGTQQINNQYSATGPSGSVVLGGANVSTIGLRNMSATRTLTLLNGQRIAPSGTGSQVAPVDYNTIPSVAIERVEVLTTGASSIYGSDAIAGVVNVRTRKGGDGLELSGFARLPERTGGRYTQANAYWGRNYDHFYVSAAVEYDRQYELNIKDRKQTACAQAFVYDPTSGDRVDARDRSGNFRCLNHNPTGIFFDEIWYGGAFVYDPTKANGPYPAAALNLQRPGNAVAAPLLDWVRTNRGGYPDTYPYSPNTSRAFDEADSISPFRRVNAYFSAGADVGSASEFYVNALYSNRRSTSNSWYFLYPILSATNPNNSVGQALIAVSNGNANGNVGPQIVRPFRAEQSVDFFQSSMGLRGAFVGGPVRGWNYDISARVGLSRGTYGQTFYYRDRLDAATAPDVACDASLITISGPVGCQSIPWLTKRFLVDQNWTDTERNFLEGYEEGHTRYDQFAIEGNLAGSLFRLPAGDVAAVVGFAIRTDDLDDTPGYNARNQNYFAASTAGRTAGSDTVREVYGELGIPLLADLPFIRKLQLTASGRYTDYASYGSNGTYRVASLWQVADPIALRGSYGTSFRAPTIYELNLADQTSFFGYTDPCVRYAEGGSPAVVQNCTAEGFPGTFSPVNDGIRGTSGGGKGRLKAETSTNINAGIVITPGFANLRIAVDYYDIKVKNEVDSFGVGNIVSSCYNLTGAQRATFCNLITRDPVTRAITDVSDPYLNLSQQHARGIDFALNFSVPIAAETSFGFEARGSRALENSIIRDALSPKQERNGLSGFPKLTAYAEGQLSWKRLSWVVGANYVGKVDDRPYWTQEKAFIAGTTNFRFYGPYAGRNSYGNANDFATVRELLTVPDYVTAYTSVTWKLRDKTMLVGGINNVFDRAPPVIGGDSYSFRLGSVPGNQYDLLGRTVFLRLKQGF
jgi:iron complex outermembrane receptor protein